MIDLKELSPKVIAVAKEAGAFIRKESENFSKSAVEQKGKSDLVSYVDKNAEKMIVAALGELLPDAGFITEEDTPDQTDREYIWIIDPLDGTTNFVHGIPPHSVSIALMYQKELVLGVVYEVTKDEAFSAYKGGGAFCNDQPIKVSEVNAISEGIYVTGFPVKNQQLLEKNLKIVHEYLLATHGIRRSGSAAADLAYVACGRFDGFFEYNLSPWDVAGGIVIVTEAGGQVSDFAGGDNYIFGRELLATGGAHEEALELVKKHW